MRILMVIAATTLLAACGGQEGAAVSACKAEIASKLEGQNFALDEADMASKATVETDGILRIQSGITFDPGLPKEVKQTFDCKVRIRDGEAEVISLQFIW
ncbi:hypothetical protein [Pseudomarimonas salicorniae]|uniref:Uncharacterized protein n=1 Tax=Pseudomarimonas salicorniae TaxID=2933270 RepID=A0ABT0GK16_9GAMM|nr:hypothetical protein [Lysobacter sp. CAU 1642]MCK7594387.1 hypothetical protein [Lysobacter sp. CAU 1642]